MEINKKFEKLENKILENEKIIGEYKQIIDDDKSKIDEMQKKINKEKDRIDILEQKSQEDKNKINDLQLKIIKDEALLNDLNNKKGEMIKEKNENIIQQIDISKKEKENEKIMELKKDGIYDSYEYIKYNNIKIDSVIIN